MKEKEVIKETNESEEGDSVKESDWEEKKEK